MFPMFARKSLFGLFLLITFSLQDGEKTNAFAILPNSVLGIPTSGFVGHIYNQSGHAGLDICQRQNCPSDTTSVGPGNEVRATYGGWIAAIYNESFNSVAGNDNQAAIVVMRHEDVPGTSIPPIYTWYMHMADEYSATSYVNPQLQLNQYYPKGTILGRQGNRRILNTSGQPIGSIVTHLHFQVQDTYLNSFFPGSLDPSPFIGLNVNFAVTDPPRLNFGDPISCNICAQPPVAPSDLSAVATEKSSNRLTWNDNSNNEDSCTTTFVRPTYASPSTLNPLNLPSPQTKSSFVRRLKNS